MKRIYTGVSASVLNGMKRCLKSRRIYAMPTTGGRFTVVTMPREGFGG